MPLLSRRCECGRAYDVLEKRGVFVGVDRDDDLPTCPSCGSEAYEAIVTLGRGIDLGDEAGVGRTYPYFDRGLGCWVSSARHRKQICKERGLIPVDGDFDEVKEAARVERWDEQDKAEQAYLDYVRELEESPHFAGFREAREKGLLGERWKVRKGDDFWRR